MGRVWKKLGFFVNKIENFLLVWLILIFGALLIADVTMRKMGISSMSWIAELSRYMLVAVTMIGSAAYVKNDGHIKMDLIVNLVGPKGQCALRIFAALVGIVFWFFFGIFSFQWMLRLIELKKSIECASIPFWPFWIPFVVPCFVAAIRYVERLVVEIRKIVKGEIGKQEAVEESAGAAAAEMPAAQTGKDV